MKKQIENNTVISRKKAVFFQEIAYLVGIFLLKLSVSIMTKANFGLSMVMAPAYILHLKISQFLPFFTIGVASYTLQFLLIITIILLTRKFKLSYFFAFVTSVICGFLLDGINLCLANVSFDTLAVRIIMFFVGVVICAFGVALMFRTYIAPEAYDLFVKELSAHFGIKTAKFKMAYDLCSCAVSVILSFSFFGLFSFNGVNVGTLVCALLNGPLIGAFGKLLDKRFEFKPLLKFKKNIT